MISTARVLILGMLHREPMHGHQIRREAELRNVQHWAGIKPGALYGTLKRMAEEGLVTPVATERKGNLPARTVFAITDEGQRVLRTLLDRALEDISAAIGPFDIALLVSDALPRAQVAELLARRAERLRLARDSLTSDRLRLQAADNATSVEVALMRHGEVHLDAELKWHDEIAGLFDDGTAQLKRPG